LYLTNRTCHSSSVRKSNVSPSGTVLDTRVSQNTLQATMLITASYRIRRSAVSSLQCSTLKPDFMTLK
jgi:hypothetical protein